MSNRPDGLQLQRLSKKFLLVSGAFAWLGRR